jgi:hypothetical protein
MHDATEAYLVDLPSPIKKHIPAYKIMEAEIHKVIAARFNLPAEIPAMVHEYDLRICNDEIELLMDVSSPWRDMGQPLGITPECWSPARAGAEFWQSYCELFT